MTRRGARLAATLLLPLALAPLRARADPPAVARRVERPRVELVVAAAQDSARLRATVSEALARIGVACETRGAAQLDPREAITPRPVAPDAAPPLARVWIDLGADPARATVYLTDARWERVLVRHVPRDAGASDEIVRESLALIVQDAVDALRAGAVIGIARERVAGELRRAPATRNAPAAAIRTGAPRRAAARAPAPDDWSPPIELAGFYELVGYSDAAPAALVHGGYLQLVMPSSIGGWRDGPVRLGLLTQVGLRSAEVAGTDLGVSVLHITARALLRLEARVAPVFRLGAAVGGAFDVLSVHPLAVGEPQAVAPAPDATLWRPVARAQLTATLVLLRHVLVTVGASCEVDAIATRYHVQYADGRETLLAPWPVRPGVFVGVGYEIDLARAQSSRAADQFSRVAPSSPPSAPPPRSPQERR